MRATVRGARSSGDDNNVMHEKNDVIVIMGRESIRKTCS